MLKRLSWIVTVPLLVVIVTFAVANRQTVTLDLFPLPRSVDLPAYLVILGGLACGLVLGMAIAWALGGRTRRRGREDRRRVEALTREVSYLKRAAEAVPASGTDATSTSTGDGSSGSRAVLVRS